MAGVVLLVMIIVGLWISDNNEVQYLRGVRNMQYGSDSETVSRVYSPGGIFDFSVTLPFDVKVEEDSSVVRLVYKEGEILIARNGTEFDSLSDYLSDPLLGSVDAVNSRSLIIDSYEAIVEEYVNSLAYFILTPNVVYSFSTDSPALYDELDAVAQSFRYTGN